MSIKNSAIFILLLSLFAGCNSIDEAITVVQVDPLKKVFKEQLFFEDNKDTAAVAKGETASFQFVFRSIYPVKNLKIEAGELMNGNHRIPSSLEAFVGHVYIPGNFLSHTPSQNRLAPVSGYFPDPLWEIESTDVASMSNQPLWVNYAIPRDAAEGTYTALLHITGETNGRKFNISKQVVAQVYNVVLPEQTLWVDNWINPYPGELRRMNGGEICPIYSERFWELNKIVANKVRDYGQNVYRILWEMPGNYSIAGKTESGQYIYDFSFESFDRMVELYIREGGLKRFTVSHIGGRINGGWYDHIGVTVPILSGDKTIIKNMPLESEEARNFLDQFIPALTGHVKEKGWEDFYLQYLADEPADGEYEPSYLRIAEYIKKLSPGLKIIDALHRTPNIARAIDIPVPMTDRLHLQYEELYKPMIESGKEVWHYTCMEPYGEKYANRFLEQPLIQTRLLHWINYRYNVKGYLHWGLNSWRNDTIQGENMDWGNKPAGDCWIIYPSYGKLHSSMRLEAMRDGINDYELLKLLESKNPAGAKELAEKTVKDFDSYDQDIVHFRQRRAKMLKWLSE
ncbi:MAG: DUF4091 domain-containing protein [Proteiniphilum sp.]|jgi:hypothetical protein|nr:DUF4091 domain-containing protein [Proteiniphilum sp.]